MTEGRTFWSSVDMAAAVSLIVAVAVLQRVGWLVWVWTRDRLLRRQSVKKVGDRLKKTRRMIHRKPASSVEYLRCLMANNQAIGH